MFDFFLRSKKVVLFFTAIAISGCIADAQTSSTPAAPQNTAPANGQAVSTAPVAGTDDAELVKSLTTAVASPAPLKIGSTKIDLASLKNLYLSRYYKPIFVSPTGAGDITQSLRSALTSSSIKNGLRFNDYWSSDIDSRLNAKSVQALTELELLLANSYLRLAIDLYSGRLNPLDDSQNVSDIEFKKRPFTEYAQLNSFIGETNVTAASIEANLQTFAPKNGLYIRLMRVLAKLVAAKQNGGWPEMKPKKVLKPGISDPAVPGIRMRLVDLGIITDEKERENSSQVYDSVLVAGVKLLQTGYKIAADGVIGKTTFSALNVTVDNKIDQVRANMERWRLLPRSFGDRFIVVDLGQQEFSLYNKGNLDLFMKVVVGQEARQTPSFMDEITDVVVNPYWHAPPSIVVKDILPKAIVDPNYWYEMRIRVFQGNQEIDPQYVDWSRYSLAHPPPFSFREEPGDNNSLGRLKFNLSLNHHSIYMHDTNHHELFEETNRMYSSGCIRLEDPRALAAYLLGPQGLDSYGIENLINNPSVVAKSITVKNPIKVFIVSSTITMDLDGNLRFGRDIYDQDKRLTAALDGARINPKKAMKPLDEGAP